MAMARPRASGKHTGKTQRRKHGVPRRSYRPMERWLRIIIGGCTVVAVTAALLHVTEDQLLRHGALADVAGGPAPRGAAEPPAVSPTPVPTHGGTPPAAAVLPPGEAPPQPLPQAADHVPPTDHATTDNASMPHASDTTSSPAIPARVTQAPIATPPAEQAASPPATRMDFPSWLAGIRERAILEGISATTFDTATRGLAPSRSVQRSQHNQSEYNKTFFQYLGNAVTGARIERGRQLAKQQSKLLEDLERRYGVQPAILLALWAMESDYGSVTGERSVIEAVATLAYQGRREEFFTNELLAALRILDEGRVSPARLKGSWAGAMGQPQFMPSTYLKYGRDGDGDGRVDIWNSVPDTLESAANYLHALGWTRGVGWSKEVLLPPAFDLYEAQLGIERSVSDWSRRGVTDIAGNPLRANPAQASILLPAGRDGPAILISRNFRALTEWNRSLHYGLTVSYLAGRIAGYPKFLRKAPPGDAPLTLGQISAMQQDLAALGFPAGEPDGMVGRQTRSALRDYQRSRGLPADAYPTRDLIARIAREAGRGSEPIEPRIDPEVYGIQILLQGLGYDVGSADGLMGPRTRAAIEAFEARAGLEVTGAPSKHLTSLLTEASTASPTAETAR